MCTGTCKSVQVQCTGAQSSIDQCPVDAHLIPMHLPDMPKNHSQSLVHIWSHPDSILQQVHKVLAASSNAASVHSRQVTAASSWCQSNLPKHLANARHNMQHTVTTGSTCRATCHAAANQQQAITRRPFSPLAWAVSTWCRAGCGASSPQSTLHRLAPQRPPPCPASCCRTWGRTGGQAPASQ